MSNSVNLVGANLTNPSYFEDFEGSVFPGWTTTGLWHLEDNNTSSYPMYGLPSDSHYMWYGDNKTGNYNTTDANYGELCSNVFDMVLFNSSSAYLEFWSWAMTESGTDYDKKQVYISADGGPWNNLGNITVDGGPMWELYSFDISSYTTYRNVQLKFVFDSVDNLANDGFGWVLDDVAIVTEPRGYFDLWINQDNNALVGETHWMDFYANSYFSHDMNVSIKIEIIGPMGTVLLYEVTDFFFPAYSSWNISKNFNFPTTGYYDVRFSLIDDYPFEWVEWCWWEVNDYGDERFDLWIEQEFYAMVGETKWMDFYAASNYNYPMENLEVKIEITGPFSGELYYNSSINFSAYEVWHLSLNYTFLVDGLYDVSFFLWNDTGLFFEAWCNWEVNPFKEHFELWIDQENFAVVGEMAFMGFNIESSFIHNMTVEVIVEIIDSYGNVDVIYNDSSLYFPAGSFWYLPLGYSFASSEYYDVHLILIDDIDAYWDAWCWFEVFDYSHEFMWLDIYQDQHAYVGDNRWMEFVIYSNYSYTFFDVTIQARVITPSGVEQLFLYENEILTPYNWWQTGKDYTFKEEGSYKINLTVQSPLGAWTHACDWEITNNTLDTLEPFIDNDKEAYVNVTEEFYVGVYNHYGKNQSFTVEVTVTHPDGSVDTIYNSTVYELGPGEKWKKPLRYTFAYTGNFTLLVAVNNGGYSGSADSFFDVYVEVDTNTSTTTTEPTRQTSISLTPGFELFLVPLVFLPLLISKKRRR